MRMLRLVSQFLDGVQNAKEYRRLIEREKLMIDSRALILPEDFFLNAVDHLMLRSVHLGGFFKKQGRFIERQIEMMIHDAEVESFLVPYNDLEEGIKDWHAKDFKESGFAEDGIRVENTFLNAVYLEDMICMINDCFFLPDTLSRHEMCSIINGEGHAVLDFWKDVRALKDYSSFFPHKPPPPKNRPPRKPQGVRKLIPVLAR